MYDGARQKSKKHAPPFFSFCCSDEVGRFDEQLENAHFTNYELANNLCKMVLFSCEEIRPTKTVVKQFLQGF